MSTFYFFKETPLITKSEFRNSLAENVFNCKYRHEGCETWEKLSRSVVNEVCLEMCEDERETLANFIADKKFIPGGRYLYYTNRGVKYYNNCYLFKSQEDTREDWADLVYKVQSALASGGGIGNDYSIYRREGAPLKRTGGVASGPIKAMQIVNEIGRYVQQGGSRRSAIWAGLRWSHTDAQKMLHVKDWNSQLIPGTNVTYGEAKQRDFTLAAPLDCTNISIIYDTAWLENYKKTGEVGEIFRENAKYAMMNGEPGFSMNFYDKEHETARNACCEITSEDDSDVCNLGSINLAEIENIDELKAVVELGTKFLLLGTLRSQLPFDRIYKTREKNRRLGLGIMGIHEWLLMRNYSYEVSEELHKWLTAYRDISDKTADNFADELNISRPVAKRAVAPTGTIGILAGTTTGIEPIYSVAYKRRYLRNNEWHCEYIVDSTAKYLIEERGIHPDSIETSIDLAQNYEKRVKFQYDVEKYIDQAVSSTINLPRWGSEHNNEEKVEDFVQCIAKYAHGLRGITCYPDGARGGQPIVPCSYEEAMAKQGQVFVEAHNMCKGGVCGA